MFHILDVCRTKKLMDSKPFFFQILFLPTKGVHWKKLAGLRVSLSLEKILMLLQSYCLQTTKLPMPLMPGFIIHITIHLSRSLKDTLI